MKARSWVLAGAAVACAGWAWAGGVGDACPDDAASAGNAPTYSEADVRFLNLMLPWDGPVADADTGIGALPSGQVDSGWAALKGAAEAVILLAAGGTLEEDPEAVRAAALEAVLRAMDPGVRILSRGEWEAERDGADVDGAESVASEEFPGGIGYAKVSGLGEGSGAALAAAIGAWDAAGEVGGIVDLRGSGGADEKSVARVGDLFAWAEGSDGLLWEKVGMGEDTRRVRAENKGVGVPVMVLADGGTRGASELLAAVLKGGARGVLVIGEETAGDPMVRVAKELSDGRYAMLPGRVIRVGGGLELNGRKGVEPDVYVGEEAKTADTYEPKSPLSLRRTKRGELEEEQVDRALRERVGADGTLQRAVDILLGLQAMGK